MSVSSITTFHKTDDVEENAMFDRRNKLLLDFFLSNALSSIRLIGNARSPVIIYQDRLRLSCYVEDFKLILRDSFKNDTILSTIYLNPKRPIDAESLLFDFIEKSEHTPVYRIALKKLPDLFLAGYNYIYKDTRFGKEPVFSVLEPRIYLSYDAAQGVVESLPKYSLEII